MDTTYELLCQSANGKQVVFDPAESHTATHFHDDPTLRSLVVDLLTGMVLNVPIIARAVDVGRTVGKSDVVMVDETDEMVWAMRKNRTDQGYVPFTKSRLTESSRLISMYLTEKDDATYELLSAWIGESVMPPFPEMKNASDDSVAYWRTHAFVWGSQEVIEGTERKDRPW